MNSFFFYKLFQRLNSETGIRLDFRQYCDFSNCFVICNPSTKSELLNLCKALWLPHQQYRQEFERLFNEEYSEIESVLERLKFTSPETAGQPKPDIAPVTSEKDSIKPDEPPAIKPPAAEPEQQKRDVAPAEVARPAETKTDLHEVVLNIEENAQAGSLQRIENDKLAPKKNGFVFSDTKHLPFHERRTVHAWRKLSGHVTFRETDRVDTTSMVKQLAQKGFVSKLLHEYETVPVRQIVWLSDHAGNMTPYEDWDNALFNTVSCNASFGKIERLYFHCYPTILEKEHKRKDFRFFKDATHLEPVLLSKLLAEWNKHTLVIIFSDGGAALGRNENERLHAWNDWFSEVKMKVRVIWFNPVEFIDDKTEAQASSGWGDSSASILSLVLPMYNLNDKGIKQAMLDL